MVMPARSHTFVASRAASRGADRPGGALRSVMSGESPVVAVTVVAAIFGYAAVQIATTMPSPADPGFASVLAVFAAFAGGALELARSRSWANVQLRAFQFGFVATGIGIALYAFGLISSAY